VGVAAQQLAENEETLTFRALAEPRRRAILRLCANTEISAGDIAQRFDVSRTAISQHLTILREAGLVSERKDGTRRLYSARAEGLRALRALLNELWATGLERAARLAETDDETESVP
jgi:DNA-binding transcriptional ArsR family regulator